MFRVVSPICEHVLVEQTAGDVNQDPLRHPNRRWKSKIRKANKVLNPLPAAHSAGFVSSKEPISIPNGFIAVNVSQMEDRNDAAVQDCIIAQ